MNLDISLETWILIIAGILAVGTSVLFFQPTEQNPAIVSEYEQNIFDEVEVKDLIVDVSDGTTEQEVIEFIKEKYPNYEIIEIAQDGLRYLIRIQEVNN
jgi:short-subunit dehydrogenase involved in D-alanine esterification of teichoic acids